MRFLFVRAPRVLVVYSSRGLTSLEPSDHASDQAEQNYQPE
jgi:hypothetical protein